VLFLDQDDQLMEDGFVAQVRSASKGDVVIGNGLYQHDGRYREIFRNASEMKFRIQEKNLIRIRNLIPSPGSCLIKKSKVPFFWVQNPLKNNGADDWMLWLLLFSEKADFVFNEGFVFRHNEHKDNRNLSADLEKMYRSSIEMCSLLREHGGLNKEQTEALRKAVDFKYLQDSKRLSPRLLMRYREQIWNNVVFKMGALAESKRMINNGR
jgi:hypothetical protein